MLEVLAVDNLARIARAESICQEQILSQPLLRARAGLVDQWGRVHRIGESTKVGRRPGQGGIFILESSISREHAEVYMDGETGCWFVRDLGSKNGTMLNEEPVTEPMQIASGDAVFFGQVGFLFVAPLEGEHSGVHQLGLASETLRAEQGIRSPLHVEAEEILSRQERAATEDDDEEDEITFVGLPRLELRLIEPSGGGGGFLETGDTRVQLTATQFAFLQVLTLRMQDEDSRPEAVRGFIRSSELLADLPWDTAHPEENHLKQLVRRVRRSLSKAGLGNLIESRRGFGYRLRVTPSSDSPDA
jgi:pSer/pThr/pTyr-binding forkhead associated (FHA) protein/DNA-binding winged helix-turn-helix (wHTH) protein